MIIKSAYYAHLIAQLMLIDFVFFCNFMGILGSIILFSLNLRENNV